MKTRLLKNGKIDFIVFDEKEENGILVELKAKGDILDNYMDQLLKYYESIRSEKSGFPRFLAEKIKGGMILNWKLKERAKDLLIPEFDEKRERIFSPPVLERFKEFKDIIEIVEIDARKEKGKKKRNRMSKNKNSRFFGNFKKE